MKSLLRVLVVASCLPLAAACDDVRFRYFGVVDPSPVVVVRPFVNPFSIFRTDLTIVRVSAFKSCAVTARKWTPSIRETHPRFSW